MLAELAAAPENLAPAAARTFQLAVGLDVDGEVGPATAGALEYYTGVRIAGVSRITPFTPGPGVATAQPGSVAQAASRIAIAGAAILLVRGLT